MRFDDVDLDSPQRHAPEPDPASVITPLSSASPPLPDTSATPATRSPASASPATPDTSATSTSAKTDSSQSTSAHRNGNGYHTGALYTEGFSTGIFDAVDAETTGTWWSSSSASERHWRSAVSADSATEPSASSAPSAVEVPSEEEEDAESVRGRGRTPARASDQQRGPRRSTVIAVIATVVVMVVAGFVGVLVNRLNVDERTVAPPTPTWPMVLPLSMDDYSRDADEKVEPSKGAKDNIWVAAANYARDGKPAVIVLVARHDDPKVVMDLPTMVDKPPLTGAIKVENGMCGFNDETKSNGCVIIKDNTGVLVLARQDQSNAELISIANRFAAAMAG